MKVSIIIPVYQEEKTIGTLLDRVALVPLEKEIIVIDDGSHDDSAAQIRKKAAEIPYLKAFFNTQNRGKGFSVRRGFAEASGDIILIQDADLEYNPDEYPALIRPIIEGSADVVYGSRFVGAQARRVLYNHHYLANKFLTFFSNLFSNLNLSDMETCYKVFSRSSLRQILPCLSSDRFGIEVEITAEAAKHRLRVYEVGISYNGRTYEEGKKITWKDGLAALFYIVWYNVVPRSHRKHS